MSNYKMADVKSMTKSLSWGTPKKYVDLVKSFFGGEISLDPCSNEYSIVGAHTEFILPTDGLVQDWNYPTIYLNPPYGSDKERNTTIKNWLLKTVATYEQYGSEILALVPVATNTGHWKQCVWGKATAICFLYDTRLRFLENGLESGNGAPMACCFVYWGRDFQKFFDFFIPYGSVVDVQSLKGVPIGLCNKL